MPYYLQAGAAKFDPQPSAYYGRHWYTVRSAFLLLQFLIYLSLIALMMLRYSRENRGTGATPDKNILFQIRFLLITFIALWVVGILHYSASLLSTTFYKTPEADLIIPLFLTAFVYALAYLGLKRPETLTVAQKPAPAKKYENSSLTPERSERYMQKLLHCMEAEFFVRMNYTDFLSREPDASGFTDWTTVLNNCGPQQGFLGAPFDCDRAHVSHGFFASPEFTNRGFLIYRMYEAGMNRLPRYSEFIPDMSSLSGFGLSDAIQQQNLNDYLQLFTSED